jgi:putative nucleotidyltransferase with HDIG domain
VNEAARRRSGLHQAYVATVFAMGALALANSLHTLGTSAIPLPMYANYAGLALLVFASGLLAVKVPSLSATLSISETFLFISVLYFGPDAAVAIVALDGLAVSLLRRRRAVRQVAFNFAEPTLSMWVAAHVYYAISGVQPLWLGPSSLAAVGPAALVLSAVYFLFNSGLNALAVATDKWTSPLAIWRKYFVWISLNYFSGASIAALLAVNIANTPGSGGFSVFSSILAIAPLVLVSYFTFKSSMGRLADENRHLGEVNRLYLKVVETLAAAVDAKDQVTHGHIRRVQTYALTLARTLGVTDDKELRAIEAAALLHDMGKLAIPEHILNKPGKLTPDEYERMKLHAPLGADMLSAVDFPYPVVPIVRHHHENWDGTGYPDRLDTERIPIGARILSVVDCYDALRSHRPYRRALSPTEALAIIDERRGTMYDPTVVDAFKAIQADIEAESVDEPLPEVLDRFAQAAREMRRPEPAADAVPLEMRVFATDMLLRLYDQLSTLGEDAGIAQTCETVSRYLLRLAPAGLVVFYRRVESTDEVATAFAAGFGEALVQDVRMPMGHGVSGWVAANGRSVINADSALDLGDRLQNLDPKFRSVLSVPLTVAKGGVGVVTLYSSQANAFREEQRQAIELISGPVAEAFSRAIQADPAKHVPTEGIHPTMPNGRALEALVARDGGLIGGASRTLGVLCVRTLGPDDMMGPASAAVSAATRIADLIFKPTEDSLVVLMPDCDPGAGRIIMDRITAAVPPGVVPPPSIDSPIRLAFACSPYDGESLRDLLATAQRRLDNWDDVTLDGSTGPVMAADALKIGGRSW